MKGRALTISLSQRASFSTKIKIPLELVEFDKSIPLKFFFFLHLTWFILKTVIYY